MLWLIVTGINIATKQCLFLIDQCIRLDVDTITQLATTEVVDCVMNNLQGEHQLLALHALGQILLSNSDSLQLQIYSK